MKALDLLRSGSDKVGMQGHELRIENSLSGGDNTEICIDIPKNREYY
jgi:hypothetical protein